MADNDVPRYRFRGTVKPSAEVKRPVMAVRNADTSGSNGQKSTSATIDIFDVIDSWGGYWGVSASEVDAALAQIGKVDTLYVRINSPGGEATEGIAIANLLRAHAATVHATNYGLAASAASFIAIAGDTLSMAPGSLLMIHEASNGVYGCADDFRAQAELLDTINESIAALYALKGGGGTAKWRTLMKAETWYTPAAAVEVKLADKVGIDVAPDAPVVPDDDTDDLPIDLDITIEITPAARAARRFDLSLFNHVPDSIAAFAAHKPPAEPPVQEPTQPEEAVSLTPEEIKALRERLGLAEDASADDINAKLDELEEAATEPEPDPTEERAVAALAKSTGLEPAKVKAALDAAKGNVSEVAILRRELDKAQAQIGELVTARAEDDSAKQAEKKKQLFEAAFAAGKIGGPSDPERIEFERDYDEAPGVIERILNGRAAGSKFPVQLSGRSTDDASASDPAAQDDYWFPGYSKPALATAGD